MRSQREALRDGDQAGEWHRVGSHLATADPVRSTQFLVERGEAPASVVYATDALVRKSVAVAGIFPAAIYDPIALIVEPA